MDLFCRHRPKILDRIRGKCPGSAKSATACQRIHGAGNDEHGIALGLGTQVDDDKDSDKNSHRAALS
ncbi:hypothetical protein [Pseudomonas chlororaphis]|uniref:hypothetical protein n=1 Tax=Pseudomonas chlororaphis TaxID=587753 RepID=UPI000F55D898|nr:hypothetical protein [Pseudomonas chlororaphis]